MDMTSRRFVASYSGGKDSILALHRAIRQGMIPDALIITYNTDMDRSWFHGIPERVLKDVSRSLQIPIRLVRTPGQAYAENFRQTLLELKKNGAEVCVFEVSILKGIWNGAPRFAWKPE